MSFAALRVARLIGVTVGASIAAFLSGSLLPGDPAVVILGGFGDPAQIEATREKLGLNHSLVHRYFTWIWDMLHGQFGQSYITHESIGQLLRTHIPVSLELMALAQTIALVLSVSLALISVYERSGRVGRVINAVAISVLSIPTFVIALLGIYLISVKTGWLPSIGWVAFRDDPIANLRDMVLPALVLASHPAVIYFRVLRRELADSFTQEYVMMARSQGLARRTVMFRHVLPPSLPAFINVVGIHVGTMIGGAVVVESIFGLPGVGSLIVAAANQSDYIVLQSCVLVIAVAFVAINLIVDLAQLALDPRVRYAQHG